MLAHHERMGPLYVLLGVYFPKKTLQLVMWNKQAPLKEQGQNGFPQNKHTLQHFLKSTTDRLL